MARGWESKSVESQIEDREALREPAGNNLHENAAAERELEVLELTRKRLLHEIAFATTRGFRAIKQRALAHVDSRLEVIKKT